MSENEIERNLGQAKKIAEQGELQKARDMILEVIEKNPQNDQALLAYAKISTSEAEAEQVLEEVLQINPNNVEALKELARIRQSSLDQMADPSTEKGVSPFIETVFEDKAEEGKPQQPFSEPTSTACIQCGKPAIPDKNYCAECQAEINQAKRRVGKPLEGINEMELERKIERLITIQQEQQEELKKISRAAQLWFWITIISIVLGLVSFCIAIASSASLLNSLNTLIQ